MVVCHEFSGSDLLDENVDHESKQETKVARQPNASTVHATRWWEERRSADGHQHTKWAWEVCTRELHV